MREIGRLIDEGSELVKLRVAVELKGRFLWGPADWWSGGAEVSTLVAGQGRTWIYGCSLDW